MICVKYRAPGELYRDEIEPPKLFDRSSVLARPLVVSRSDLEARIYCQDLRITQGLGKLIRRPDRAWQNIIRPGFLKKPFVVGGEGLAEIVEAGPDVVNLKVGQKVIVPTQLSCGHCRQCKTGFGGQCENYRHDRFGGFGLNPDRGGLLSELILVPDADRQLVIFPDDLDLLEYAAAGGDLAQTWCRVWPHLEKRRQQRVLVLGGEAASQGLYAVAMAARCELQWLAYHDPSAERAAIAASYGASVREDDGSRLRDEYDLVVCASTRAESVDIAVRRLAPGGVCAMILPPDSRRAGLPLQTLYARNGQIDIGLPDIVGQLPDMLACLRRNPMSLSAINTHIAAFEQAEAEFGKRTTRVVVTRYQ